MNVVILASGDFPHRAYPLYLLSQADRLVCCDGTLSAIIRKNLHPDALIGDLDSEPKWLRKKLRTEPPLQHGATVLTADSRSEEVSPRDEFSDFRTLDLRLANGENFPLKVVHVTEQDFNDLSKAMRYTQAFYPEATSITILGATGKREAHTVGNLSSLMEYERRYHFWERGIDVQMVSDWSTAFAIGDSCKLNIGEGRAVSFFTFDQSLQIHSEGLQWPLDAVVFENWWVASLNRATMDEISLKFNHPAPLLVILD